MGFKSLLMGVSIWCSLLVCFTRLAHAQATDYFINPPLPGPNKDYSQNKPYAIGSIIDLKWNVDYPNYSLAVWQDSDYPKAYNIRNTLTSSTSTFAWTVEIPPGIQSDISSAYYFEITNTSNGNAFTSHYFNITTDGTPTTQTVFTATASGGSSTSTETLTPSITAQSTVYETIVYLTPTSTATGAPSTSSSPAGSSGGLSSSAKVGIGVGVGVGVTGLLIGLGIGFLLWRRSSGRKEKTSDDAAPSREKANEEPPDRPEGFFAAPKPPDHPGELSEEAAMGELSSYGQKHELPGENTQAQELSGHARRYELPGHEPSR